MTMAACAQPRSRLRWLLARLVCAVVATGTLAEAQPAPSTTTNAAPVDSAPAVPREFRGVWVASVANIDWPSARGLSTAAQQAELLALLDRAVALRLNAVILQVRPAADALYASSIEPWSEYLTGTQGKAPSPFWDPLAFAVREAHARQLELHAWFNPYRAKQPGAKSRLAKSHIARRSPALVKTYGEYLWMDPGEPAVRARTVRVVLDVVQRYDIDGVHLDDYFYPYPEARNGREVPFPDDASWKRYRAKGGTLVRDAWRRRNVDLLIETLHDRIHDLKPWVKFGISPFGIWRPGYPAQIRGFDAYDKLYADARKWLQEGWVDYITPQLYWPTTKVEQAYPVLLQWWSAENTQGRHLWPGNFTSRAGGSSTGDFPVSELVEQIRVTRAQSGATGNVHFSMKSFVVNRGGLNDSLQAGPYTEPALVPASPWLAVKAPAMPVFRRPAGRRTTNTDGVELVVTKRTTPWQWLVQFRTDSGWVRTLLPGTATHLTAPEGVQASQVTVRALNRAGVASAPVSRLMPVPGSKATTTTTRGAAGGR